MKPDVPRRDRVVYRLLLGFMLLSPLPLAGLAWLYIDAFERALTTTVLTSLATLANKKADKINAYLDERLATGHQLARSSILHAALRRTPHAIPLVEQMLRDVHAEGQYHDILLINLAGDVVYSVRKENDLGTNLNTGPWRDSALAEAHRNAMILLSTQTSMAPAYPPSGNKPAIFFVTPVFQNGRLLGSVALQLDLKRFTEVSSDNTGLGETGETVLAQLEPGGVEALYVGPLRHVEAAPFRHRLPLTQVAAPMRAALRGEYGHGLSRDYAGIDIAAAWRHLPALGWGMVVKMNVEEALAPAPALRRYTLTALFLLLLLAGLGALWIGRGLVRPIQQLTATTRKLAAGDLRQRAAPSGCLEFTELAASFNQMADRICEDQARLEERVHERTQALAESEATLRRAQAVARIGSWRLDSRPGGGGLTWSEENYRLFGIPAGAPLSYDAFLSAVHPDDRARVDAAWQAALQGAPYAIDHRIVVNGETRWVRERAELEFDADGQLAAGVGTVQDITREVESDAALRASEMRFRGIFERANVGIAFGDAEGNIIACNTALAEMIGHDSADALIGTNFGVITHPDDLPADLAYFAEIKAGQRDEYRLEKRYLRRNGGVTWVDLSVATIRETNGKLVNFVAMVVDISTRKRTEVEYRAILDTTMDGFWMTDLKGRFLEMNAAYCELIGYSRDELLSMAIPDIEAIEHPEETRAHIEAILVSGHDRFETLHRHKDGHLIDVEVSVNYLAVEDGRLVVFLRDITQRKQAERTLIEAKQAAEVANRAKSEFIANMSHEIRTPMNAILGLTQLVLDSELSPRQKDFLKKAHTSARALLGILNDILDYSKIEAGRLDIESVPIAIEDVLRGVADLFSARIEEKGLELFIEIDPSLPARVLTDPLRLTQILNNLVGNAIKFTEAGEIHIKAKAGERTQDQITLLFSVRDTGIGLPKAQVDRLFQAFTQADASITRRYGGTGLGLAISQRLIQLMHGDIEVSSVEGGGATFTFTLRAGLVAEAENGAAQQDLRALGGRRVLVVDDQPTARAILLQLISAWDMRATAVEDGPAALAALEAARVAGEPYDVLLLDWRMPGMSGLDVARQLQADSDTGHPLLLMMVTAHDKEALLGEAASIRIDGLLTKPVTPSALFDALAGSRPLDGQPAALLVRDEILPDDLVFPGARILLVEDNPTNQLVAAEFMRHREIEVHLAENGAAAVDAVAQQPFDLILMDLHMPVMDGFSATRKLRERPDAPPIVAMTAAVLNEDRARCEQAGMVDFIAKPIEPEALIRALRKWLPKHVVRRAASERPEPARGLPASLPGIDLDAALARFDGDHALYARLLQGFARDHANTVATLEADLTRGDLARVNSRLHALKGEAANLGASRLAEACARLESLLKSETATETLDNALANFTATLTTVRASIASGVDRLAPKTAASDTPLDREMLAELLDLLDRHLVQHELVPDEAIERLHALAQGESPNRPLARLLRQIDEFDHDAALATIAQLRALADLPPDRNRTGREPNFPPAHQAGS